jgi:DNA-binding response OmpR family regulator
MVVRLTPRPPRKKKVLLLDDSRLVIELTRAALEDAGFEVATAEDLTTFEAERKRTPPDVILVDVQMPEAFGDDVASTLRGAYGVDVPILLVSTLEDGELASRALLADADGFVCKRAGLDALVCEVRAQLTRREQRGVAP